jgi:UPF0755 protein
MQRTSEETIAKKNYFSALTFVRRYGWMVALVLVGVALTYSFIFGPVNADDTTAREVIVAPEETFARTADTLMRDGLTKHWFALPLAAWLTGVSAEVRPGGYRIAPSMDVWTILHAFSEAPYLTWIDIPQGLRKEEIAMLFAEEFQWNEQEVQEFLEERSISPDLSEGAYYAGTYLLPSDIAPKDVAGRLRTKFEDAYAPYAHWASMEGQSWEDVITFASLIEREAGRTDKKLVAGILKNRLEQGMKLQVDATLQYITGSEEEGWWHAPSSEDKYIESPFNTYIYEGLPPAPIASPALSSIEAVLDPADTSCLYYLHDNRGQIHCSATYEQHKINIDRYLR